jgi:hypothetical protein
LGSATRGVRMKAPLGASSSAFSPDPVVLKNGWAPIRLRVRDIEHGLILTRSGRVSDQFGVGAAEVWSGRRSAHGSIPFWRREYPWNVWLDH